MKVYSVHVEGPHASLVGVFGTEAEAHQAVRRAMKDLDRHWSGPKDELGEGDTELWWASPDVGTIYLRQHEIPQPPTEITASTLRNKKGS